MTNSSLCRELWEGEPPQSATATLQTYIAQIRRFLASCSGQRLTEVMRNVLITEPGGYVLRVPPGKLDLYDFERYLAGGRAALAQGELEIAVTHFRNAVNLWTGSPLENVHHGTVLEAQVRRLEELRLGAAEDLYDLELRLGNHQRILADLTELAWQNPLHENLHALLMAALYMSGRRSDALIAFHALRGRLAEELGLDPSPRLISLQHAILNHEGDPLATRPEVKVVAR
ncbi:DNA-binding SARP family transcriptional activator [Allostreptomyces psammosilenae]|uniref:DNA-binding SARP family transcriptional activator n=1 Tax=Allostreptomyces psammosilenae TaxID=1892865 RepID=A0A852ZTN8_9ACTN|nr:DNA-binding SARP family transcriptional activator [Allostreptomyces psammosilenae]